MTRLKGIGELNIFSEQLNNEGANFADYQLQKPT